jgi:hypothetical protein
MDSAIKPPCERLNLISVGPDKGGRLEAQMILHMHDCTAVDLTMKHKATQ